MKLFTGKPKKQKQVNQCPICGAMLDPVTAICPDCKYEGSGMTASRVVEEFSEQIKHAGNTFNSAVAKVIESFPVPSGRNDLLEILAFLCPKIKPIIIGDKKKDLRAIEEAQVYFHKFKECILRVKAFYPNDPSFATYLAEYRSYTPTEMPKKKRFSIKALIIILLSFVLLVPVLEFVLELLDVFMFF